MRILSRDLRKIFLLEQCFRGFLKRTMFSWLLKYKMHVVSLFSTNRKSSFVEIFIFALANEKKSL